MKNHYFVLILATLLCIAISIAGCYTYFPISNNDLLNKKTENKVKITLRDKKEIFVENRNEIDLSTTDQIVVLQKDSTKITYSLQQVDRVFEERFDFPKTLFATLWIVGGTTVLILGILLSGKSGGLSGG